MYSTRIGFWHQEDNFLIVYLKRTRKKEHMDRKKQKFYVHVIHLYNT